MFRDLFYAFAEWTLLRCLECESSYGFVELLSTLPPPYTTMSISVPCFVDCAPPQNDNQSLVLLRNIPTVACIVRSILTVWTIWFSCMYLIPRGVERHPGIVRNRMLSLKQNFSRKPRRWFMINGCLWRFLRACLITTKNGYKVASPFLGYPHGSQQ